MIKSLLKLAKVLSPSLLQKKNVVGVGLGKKNRGEEDALIVFVTKKEPMEYLSREDMVPKKVLGVKTDVEECGQIELLEGKPSIAEHRYRHRPVQGGISGIWHKSTACTIGAVVEKNGQRCGLSNQHCFNPVNKGAQLGQDILQPSPADGGQHNQDTIGVSIASSQIKYGRDNETDAALCALEVPSEPTILGIGSIDPRPVDPKVGDSVVKSGRTTGVTTGQVIATDVDALVWTNLPDGSRVVSCWKNQVFFDNPSYSFVNGGDSGSVCLRGNRPHSLIFAASDKVAIATPIKRVMNELGFTFLGSEVHHGYIALGEWLDIKKNRAIIKQRTNLRTAPSLSAEVIRILPIGEKLTIVGSGGMANDYLWLEVEV